MKRSDLYVFREGLEMNTLYMIERENRQEVLPGAKFTYAATKNKRRVNTEIKDMEKAKEPSKEFKEYQDAQEEINRKYADKDSRGNPKTEQRLVSATRKQTFYIIPDIENPNSKHSKETEKLEKKHKEVIDIQSEKEEAYRKFLEDETEWKPFMINLEDVPDEIPQRVMERIYFMIRETEL